MVGCLDVYLVHYHATINPPIWVQSLWGVTNAPLAMAVSLITHTQVPQVKKIRSMKSVSKFGTRNV